jgi:predicted DNA-binding protein
MTNATEKTPNKSFSVKLPEEVIDKLKFVARETGLSANDVVQLSIRRGLPAVENFLGLEPADQAVS